MNPRRPARPPRLALAALLCCAACGAIEPRTGGDGGAVIVIPADAGVPACRGNGDGTIARDELVFVPGVTARYRINPPNTLVSVDVTGTVRADGSHVWDFSDGSGDLVELTLSRASDGWYASDFAGAQWASRLDPREAVVGVYRATDDALLLLGAASEERSTGTELRYDTPVPLLQFPLAQGKSWAATANVLDGRVQGLPVASRDRYSMTVDAVGELRLGILTFPKALRLRIELVQSFPAGPGKRRIQYLWLTECYGEVARITSKDGELDPAFTQALEFRRLGL